MNLFKITADYRPCNPHKPYYYAYGKTEKEAKKRFTNVISWLKVYEIEKIDALTAKSIIAEPSRHIVI